MSTQPTQLPELPPFHPAKPTAGLAGTPVLPKSPEFESQNQIQNRKSLLDEPWKVTLIPAAAPVGEDPHAAKALPWRVGDVTRLKDDSPKGMMEYIATHSTGWWREMAERALRDTDKAERMAREQGWEYGQYWALEVDAEAKQKLLDAEEAKRQREEAERAREAAEKEAFVQRQMELLEKAGRAPRCEYQYTDGRGCRAPQVKGERWCHVHAKMMSYRPEKLEILPMEDEQAVMVNLYRVTQSLVSGRVTEKTAALVLWSASIVAPGLRKSRVIARKRNVIASDRKGKTKTFETRRNRVSGGKARHPGVMGDKSFKSGVEAEVPPGTRTRDSLHRENSLNRRGHDRHSRDLSTPTRVADACSESLKMRMGGKCRDTAERGNISAAGQQISVSPRLRGEVELGAREHSSVSPCLSGEIESRDEIGLKGAGEIASFQAGD